MSTNTPALLNPRTNSTTLGALWIVYAILRFAAGFLLVLYSGTASVMFGALLTRVPEPYTLMATFHVVYIAVIMLTALSAVFALLAALSLLTGKASARFFSLVASFLALSDLPLGTTLGIYTLIVFIP